VIWTNVIGHKPDKPRVKGEDTITRYVALVSFRPTGEIFP
jgi:hypothetical protein